MADPFENVAKGLDSPADDAFTITPSDTNDLATIPRGLYVGIAGDLKVMTAKGTTVEFRNVSGVLPVRVRKVFSTGQTGTIAAAIVGLL